MPLTSEEISVAVSSEGDRVFVTTPVQGMGTVFAIDTSTNSVVNTIHVPDGTRDATTLAGVAISPNGKRLYVVDRGCLDKSFGGCGVNAPEGKLRVIEAATGTLLDMVKAFANFDPKEIVSDPRRRWVFAAPTYAPPGVAPFIVAYDRHSGRTQVAEIGGQVGADDVSLAVHPTGQWLYVSQRAEGLVDVLDVTAIDLGVLDPVVARIPVASQPRGMAVHPAGTVLYVLDQDTHRVVMVDTATNQFLRSAGVPANLISGSVRSLAVDPEHDRLYVLSGGIETFDTDARGFTAFRMLGPPISSPTSVGTFMGPPSYCGNAVVEAGEQCDDGGVCVDSLDAGKPCHSSFGCAGDGRCVPVGGDGCATNCTLETEIEVPLVPGIVASDDLASGTSGLVFEGADSAVVAPVTGTLRLYVGAERNHEIPIAMKAGARFPAVPLAGGCACLASGVQKTCGGTLLLHDALSPAPDCTVDDQVCTGELPCQPVYGEGNLGAGIVRCDALYGVDVSLDAALAAPPRLRTHLAGAGGPGSARIPATLTLAIHPGACTGDGPAYGPDGILCTADDAVDPTVATIVLPMTLSTGTARGTAVPSDNQGQIGPVTASGLEFDCAALRAGDAAGVGLVGASSASSSSPVSDALVLTALFAASLPTRTATPTSTSAVTATRTQPLTSTATYSPPVPPTSTRTSQPTPTPVSANTATPTITAITVLPPDAIDASGHWILTVGAVTCETEVTQTLQTLQIVGTCSRFTFELRGWIDVVTGSFQASGSASGCSPLTADGTIAQSGSMLTGAIVCSALSGALTGSRQAIPATPTGTARPTLAGPTTAPSATHIATPTRTSTRTVTSVPPGTATATQTASRGTTATATSTARMTDTTTPSWSPTLPAPPTHTPVDSEPPTPTAMPSQTASLTATETATPTPVAPTATRLPACPGDCSGDGIVTVDELIAGVRMSLERRADAECRAFDRNGDGRVTIEELVAGVNAALRGC